jgi:hypothetical protein
MFYSLTLNGEKYEASLEDGTNPIFARETNLDEIVYKDIKKGWFRTIVMRQEKIEDWPNVEFYYDSTESNLETEYLLNVANWPVIHIKVMKKFIEMGIEGLRFFPIKLIDTITGNLSSNYVLMYIENFIEAYDMERSKYEYNEKYDFYFFWPNATYMNVEVCSQYDIFKCVKEEATIYVSQRVKDAIEENHWDWFSFYKQRQ